MFHENHKVRITIMRKFRPDEVFDEFPVTVPEEPRDCEYFEKGQEMIVDENLEMPDGFCTVAWQSIFPTVRILSFGGNYPWFKEEGVAFNACIDGLRPVIFKLERV